VHRPENDFSVGGAKTQSRQLNSEYNFMQNVFFKKGIIQCAIGSGAKPPEAGEFSRIFELKVTLQSVKLLLTVSCRTNWGAGFYSLPQ